MHTICSINAPVSSAYFIKRGPVFVQLDHAPVKEIKVQEAVVGMLEYFLKQEGDGGYPPRVMTLQIKDASVVDEIPLTLVEKIKDQYEFGFNCNRFLSHLLVLTNGLVAELSKHSKSERRHQLQARAYARFVDDMQKTARENGFSQLKALAESKKKSDLYVEGMLLNREIDTASIVLPAKPVAKFVEKLSRGSYLCKAGDPASKMYVLLRGKIGVSIDGHPLGTIDRPGEGFGELGLFLRGRRTCDLYADEDSLLYAIDSKRLRGFHMTHRHLFTCLAATLSSRIENNLRRMSWLRNEMREAGSGGGAATSGKHELTSLFRELERLRQELRRAELDKLWQRHAHHYNRDEGNSGGT